MFIFTNRGEVIIDGMIIDSKDNVAVASKLIKTWKSPLPVSATTSNVSSIKKQHFMEEISN